MGVLTRIARLFVRRGFNIDALAVGLVGDERTSRITPRLGGAVHPIDEVTLQLPRLVDVLGSAISFKCLVRPCDQIETVRAA